MQENTLWKGIITSDEPIGQVKGFSKSNYKASLYFVFQGIKPSTSYSAISIKITSLKFERRGIYILFLNCLI